ncbi:MAG: tetratricopeptide repeat protein [Chloroflexi bacterium]|nr:tetratricopeptide repeat protein [Chloroflexota bacterium]
MPIPPLIQEEAFQKAINVSDDQIDLAYAVLLFALDEFPDLDIPAYVAQLDLLANQVRRSLPDHASGKDTLGTLNRVLFRELNFSGNLANYYDPENSYLNRVLERRMGIPISLSVVYLEVGRRLGIPLVGVGLPGHFVVQYLAEPVPLYIDPFGEGALLSRQDCQDIITRVYGQKVFADDAWFQPQTKRQILARMLHNLKAIYLQRQDLARVLQIQSRLLIVNPADAAAVRDMGLICAQVGERQMAVIYLQRYLALAPQAPDAARVQQLIEDLITQMVRWN